VLTFIVYINYSANHFGDFHCVFNVDNVDNVDDDDDDDDVCTLQNLHQRTTRLFLFGRCSLSMMIFDLDVSVTDCGSS